MRSFWIKTHLYIAAFFLPVLVIMATTGGLYLLGYKGSVTSTPVALVAPDKLNPKSPTLDNDVRQWLDANGVEHHFEYVKVSGSTLITRPTSRTYYEIDLSSKTITAAQQQPDLVKSLIELHKGHGPLLFKDFQKVMAAGLLIVLLSGFWLGISSAGLRTSTGLTTLAGLIIFALLAFFL